MRATPQRSALEPPRAKNGLALRASRALRRRLTACGAACKGILKNVSVRRRRDALLADVALALPGQYLPQL